jgi:hypothetical protein
MFYFVYKLFINLDLLQQYPKYLTNPIIYLMLSTPTYGHTNPPILNAVFVTPYSSFSVIIVMKCELLFQIT